jgi:hypothetical protein
MPWIGHPSRDVEGERERPLSRWNYTVIYRVALDRRAEGGEADIEIVRILGPGPQVDDARRCMMFNQVAGRLTTSGLRPRFAAHGRQ